MGIIYKASFPNNKCYIGQTKFDLEKRKKEHKESSKFKDLPFYKAIRKYGWDCIVWEIIDKAETSEELDEKEIYWIEYYNSYGSGGYNATKGGDGHYAPIYFITQESINELLQRFKKSGDITLLSEQYNVGYNLIRGIIQGEIRQDISGINDKSFYNKYKKKGLQYTNEQIDLIISLHNQGLNNSDIEKMLNIPIKYIQDILSGRILSKKTGIPHITREERQKSNPVNSKMTKDQVLQILEWRKDGMEIKEIANKLGKNSARIYEILSGKTWSAVTGIKYTPNIDINGTPIRKLSSEDVLTIVAKYKDGISKSDLSKEYNISETSVYRIISGIRWNNITHIKD